MEDIQDTPEQTDSAGLESALDAAWGGEDDQEEIEETQETEDPVVEDSGEEPEEPKEESFSNLDPEKLPDEVKPFYKSLQASFTKKRQEDASKVSEIQKQLDELKASQTKSDELQELVAKVQAGDQEAFNKLMALNKEQPESEEERIERIIREREEKSFFNEALREYPKTDTRVDETSPDYDPILDTWLRSNLGDALDIFIEREGTSVGFDHKTTAQNLLKKWDKYLVDKNTAYLKKQSEMAKNKSVKTRKLAPETSSAKSSPDKNMSLEESIEAAFSQG